MCLLPNFIHQVLPRPFLHLRESPSLRCLAIIISVGRIRTATQEYPPLPVKYLSGASHYFFISATLEVIDMALLNPNHAIFCLTVSQLCGSDRQRTPMKQPIAEHCASLEALPCPPPVQTPPIIHQKINTHPLEEERRTALLTTEELAARNISVPYRKAFVRE